MVRTPADEIVLPDTPVNVVCSRPDRPSQCDRCHRQTRWQSHYVMCYTLMGHPWDHDAGAWWCWECLDAASYVIGLACSHEDAVTWCKP